jgi:hypothetical protein
MENVPLLDLWVVVGVVNVALGLIRKIRYPCFTGPRRDLDRIHQANMALTCRCYDFKDILLIVSENNAHKIRSRCRHWLLSVS